MRRGTIVILALALASAAGARPAFAGGLNGSHASMEHQHAVAVRLDYSFVRTPAQVATLVADSALRRVDPTPDLVLSGVSYPYARPETRAFVERLAAAYDSATGGPLVVTSLTRPIDREPGNASPLSVHPAGMAVDLRLPEAEGARAWLEARLLSLEQVGVVDVTREHRPPHLHVAVFPDAFRLYAARQDSAAAIAAAAARAAAALPHDAQPATRSAAGDGESRTLAIGVFGATLVGLLALAGGDALGVLRGRTRRS